MEFTKDEIEIILRSLRQRINAAEIAIIDPKTRDEMRAYFKREATLASDLFIKLSEKKPNA